MHTPTDDPIVAAYLDRLYRCAAVLPLERRLELVEEISDHITEARTSGTVTDEAAVRTLLDRLGAPEEIVAAAREDGAFGSVPPGYVIRQPTATVEAVAVGLLIIGSIIPVIGWLVGIVLVWTSSRWRRREKVLATLIVPGGPGAVLWFSLIASGSESCTSSSSGNADATVTSVATVCTHSGISLPPVVGVFLLGFWLIAPVVVATLLYRAAARRASAESAVAVPAAVPGRVGGLEISAVVLLAVGGFLIPVVAPLVGLALAWLSSAWDRREKLIASGMALGGMILGAFLLISVAA